MMKSMTAYAVAEKNEQDILVRVEMRAYNSRHLDIALRLSQGYLTLEEKIKGLISQTIERGRIDVRIMVKDSGETASAYEVDLPKARAYHAAAQTLEEDLKLKVSLSVNQLAAVPGVIRPAENSSTAETVWPLMAVCLQQTLQHLDQMRRQEGAFVAKDLGLRIDAIEDRLIQIEKNTDGLLPLYRDKLHARIKQLTQGEVDLDPARITQEAALLADRSDISEEIVRVKSHIEQFRATMAGDEPAGRKLNFLLQEFNREFNTMGSKAGQASVAHIIVDVKAEIEKIREQVQNIE